MYVLQCLMFFFSPGRLPSLRPARDLTLGAASGITPAKVFNRTTDKVPCSSVSEMSFS